MPKRRWRKDKGFVSFLLAQEYCVREEEKLKPNMTEGVIIFMFESWTAARQPQFSDQQLSLLDKTGGDR